MNGIERITGRIEADAQEQAKAIAAEAEARRIETIAKANEEDWKRVGGAKIGPASATV